MFRWLFGVVDAALGSVAVSVAFTSAAVLAGLIGTAFVLKLSSDVEVAVGLGVCLYVALAILVVLGVRRA